MVPSLQTSKQVHGGGRGGAHPAGLVKISPVTKKVADMTTTLPLHPLCYYSGFQHYAGSSR